MLGLGQFLKIAFHSTESAWMERDAAQSREQVIQVQMQTMREKLEKMEKDAHREDDNE